MHEKNKMEEPTNNKKYLILFVILFAIGIILGFFLAKNQSAKEISALQSQITKLQNENTEMKKYLPSLPDDVRALLGKVQKIDDNNIIVDLLPSATPYDKLVSPRYVTITNKTKIYRTELKNLTDLMKELKDYQKKLEEKKTDDKQTIILPVLTIDKEISASELKPGFEISISAEQNIRDKERLEAEIIRILPFVELN